MSKSNVVVPKVASAKVLARYSAHFDALTNTKVNPEAKAMLLESTYLHDKHEDRMDHVSATALDDLSPHARAALNRLLGTPRNPE